MRPPDIHRDDALGAIARLHQAIRDIDRHMRSHPDTWYEIRAILLRRLRRYGEIPR